MRANKPKSNIGEFVAYMRSDDAQLQRLKPGKRTAFWKRFKAKKHIERGIGKVFIFARYLSPEETENFRREWQEANESGEILRVKAVEC